MQLEEDITNRLARTLDLELTAAESRRAQSERPNDPDAVDLTMRAKSILNQPPSPERLAQAQDLFEQALRIDPQLPAALVGLARTQAAQANSHWSTLSTEQLVQVDEAVTRVLSAFPNNAMAHFVRGEVLREERNSTLQSLNMRSQSRSTTILQMLMHALVTSRSALAEPSKRLHRLSTPFA
jgi:hypothetical protein